MQRPSPFTVALRFALPALLASVSFSAPPAVNTMGTDPLALASDPFLIEVLYKTPDRLGSAGHASGAVSVNAQWEEGTSKEWFIEQQRYGADYVQAGVVMKDDKLVQTGIKVLAWGFAHQGPDGDFPGTGDPIHSTSLFVEAAARAAILLKQSKVPAYEQTVKDWTPKIRAAALWMQKPEVGQKNREKTLDPYTHRFYLRAAALGQAGVLAKDQALIDAAAGFARDGVKRQLPDGTNPEKGGFDVSYQFVGLTFALRYYSVCGDTGLRNALKTMSEKSLANAITKVGPDGSISTEGSTRTGVEAGRTGKAKTIDYKNIIQALVFGARIDNEPKDREIAQRLAKANGWM